MSALTAPATKTGFKGPLALSFGRTTKATKVFYNGALVMLEAVGKFLIPAAGTSAGGICCGVIDLDNKASVDTTGQADGDTPLNVKCGIFPFAIGTSTDALVKADEGNDVYVIDDQTVGKTDGAVGRPIAGQLMLIGDARGNANATGDTAWVSIGGPRLPNAGATVGRGSVETITGGAPSVATEITFLSITGTVVFGALPDGKFIGQRKAFMVTVAASTPVGSLTVTTKNGFSTISGLGAVGRTVELEWTSSGWALIGNGGATIT